MADGYRPDRVSCAWIGLLTCTDCADHSIPQAKSKQFSGGVFGTCRIVVIQIEPANSSHNGRRWPASEQRNERSRTMRKNLFGITVLICLILIVGFTVTLQAAGAGKQTNLPVTSTIADTDPLGTAYQIQSDGKIQIDGTTDYTNTKSVQSVIQPGGDWVLDTNYSSLSDRGVFLDFSQPLDGSSPGPDPSKDLIGVKARLITQCTPYGYGMLSLTKGQTVSCGLVIHFDYNGISYQLAMNPLGVNNYSETDPVNITCGGTDANGQCNRWSILPEGGAGGTSVARLSQRTTVKGHYVFQKLADFRFAFSMNVTNP